LKGCSIIANMILSTTLFHQSFRTYGDAWNFRRAPANFTRCKVTAWSYLMWEPVS